jgi:hypothetical protein
MATTALLVVPRPAVPLPRSQPPTLVSSTSTTPPSRSRSGRTMARRNLCIHVHAVRYEPIPSTRYRPSAETPVVWEVTSQTAANQSVSGKRARWKIVPAVTDVLRDTNITYDEAKFTEMVLYVAGRLCDHRAVGRRS